MLILKNVNKIYKSKYEDVQAVDDVSLTFKDTGMYFLVGKSGCGKTTLLNCLGLLDNFDNGEYLIDGVDILSLSRKKRDSFRNEFIGFVFQEYNLLEDLSVYENITLSFELQGKEIDNEHLDNILNRVGMLDYKQRKINELSGGQKQRVAIARSLVKNPKMILADEPSGALDSNTSLEIFELLKEISKDSLVIVVSHDLEYANQFGDEVITIKDGEIASKQEVIVEDSNNSLVFNNLRQPLRSKLKLGFKFLKSNKKSFIFSTILSSIALIFFGVAISLSIHNKYEAIYETMKDNDINYMTYSSNYDSFSPYAIDQLEDMGIQNPIYGYKFEKKIILGNYFYENVQTNDYPLISKINFDEEMYLKHGIKKIAGQLPTNENEVMISDYVFELFKIYGYKGIKISEYNDLIGKELGEYTITGLIHIPFDMEIIKEYYDPYKSYPDYYYYKREGYQEYGLHFNLFFWNNPFDVKNDVYEGNIYFKTDNSEYEQYTNFSLTERIKEIYYDETFDQEKDHVVMEIDYLAGLKYSNSYENILEKYMKLSMSEIEARNKIIEELKEEFCGKKIKVTKSEKVAINMELPVAGIFFSNDLMDNVNCKMACSKDLLTLDEEKITNVNRVYSFFTKDDNKNVKMIKLGIKEPKFNSDFDVIEKLYASNYAILEYDDVEDSIKTMSYVFLGIGFVLCLIAILILYFNVSRNIYQKRKEIGILKSLGSTNEDIFTIFYFMSFIVSIITIVFSVVIVRIINEVICNSINKNLGFTFNVTSYGYAVLIIFLLSMIVPLLGSFNPVYKLAKKKPVDIINDK